VNAGNYGVGVYLNGAGFTLQQAENIESGFAFFAATGNNAIRITELDAGWNQAESGAFLSAPQIH